MTSEELLNQWEQEARFVAESGPLVGQELGVSVRACIRTVTLITALREATKALEETRDNFLFCLSQYPDVSRHEYTKHTAHFYKLATEALAKVEEVLK